MINGINKLISAVSPDFKLDVTKPVITPVVAKKGEINLFALSTLTTVLSAQERLLDGDDHSREGDTVVYAGQVAAAYQQVQNAEPTVQVIV